jgi:hypothetical protein
VAQFLAYLLRALSLRGLLLVALLDGMNHLPDRETMCLRDCL